METWDVITLGPLKGLRQCEIFQPLSKSLLLSNKITLKLTKYVSKEFMSLNVWCNVENHYTKGTYFSSKIRSSVLNIKITKVFPYFFSISLVDRPKTMLCVKSKKWQENSSINSKRDIRSLRVSYQKLNM